MYKLINTFFVMTMAPLSVNAQGLTENDVSQMHLICPAIYNYVQPEDTTLQELSRKYFTEKLIMEAEKEDITEQEAWMKVGTEFYNSDQITDLESYERVTKNILAEEFEGGVMSEEEVAQVKSECDQALTLYTELMR